MGCRARVHTGDHVMECRSCNWYLCERCHPQEREQRSLLWGSVSLLADKAMQELGDLKDVADIIEKKGPLAACAAPPLKKNGSGDDGEITFEEGSSSAPTAPPITPVGAEASAEAADQPTPPKTEAPKSDIGVDLLGLDSEPLDEKLLASVDVRADGAGPLDLL